MVRIENDFEREGSGDPSKEVSYGSVQGLEADDFLHIWNVMSEYLEGYVYRLYIPDSNLPVDRGLSELKELLQNHPDFTKRFFMDGLLFFSPERCVFVVSVLLTLFEYQRLWEEHLLKEGLYMARLKSIPIFRSPKKYQQYLFQETQKYVSSLKESFFNVLENYFPYFDPENFEVRVFLQEHCTAEEKEQIRNYIEEAYDAWRKGGDDKLPIFCFSGVNIGVNKRIHLGILERKS